MSNLHVQLIAVGAGFLGSFIAVPIFFGLLRLLGLYRHTTEAEQNNRKDEWRQMARHDYPLW